MLSINTNLSSFIAQNSMRTSTNKLNQAIERMTTGTKLNHAKDNAANYSINTNMTTKIGAYDVAADNTAMGLDMVATASDTISQMQDHATRLRSLATQARNGTYGDKSLIAIQTEANAITKEIERLYNTAQYNGVSLFNQKDYEIASHLPQAGKSGFIDETALSGPDPPTAKYNGFIENPVTYTDSRLAEMLASGNLVVLETDLEYFDSTKSYLINDKTQLEHLAELVNEGKDSSDVTFILGANIDLKGEEWTPIGNSSNRFKGVFDGNGHKIKNLKIDNQTADYQGLFGYTNGAEIKNVGLDGGHVEGNNFVGFLVGYNNDSTITNSYSTGSVSGQGDCTGGLVGVNYNNSTITNSYSTGPVSGQGGYTGGLVGTNVSATITNCYSTGYVSGQGERTGGLVGESNNSTITNCYSTGYVSGQGERTGGLVGQNYNSSTITNCYSTGSVTGQGECTGGLVGYNTTNSNITNCYSTGPVSGQGVHTGGLVGRNGNNASITNCYSTGSVSGQGYYTGGLVGQNYTNSTITNCYSTGSVYGQGGRTGGLVGESYSSSTITNSYSTGSVSGQKDYTGGLVGLNQINSSITNCSSTGSVTGQGNNTGGLVGYNTTNSSITNSYSTGSVSGQGAYTGGLVGLIDSSTDCEINGCVAYGKVITSNLRSGSLIGGIRNTADGVNFSTINITNCQVMPSDKDAIGIVIDHNWAKVNDYDMSAWLAEISDVEIIDRTTHLQVGIQGDGASKISFNTNFKLDFTSDIVSDSALASLDEFINLLSEKSTMLGSVSNRLESVLDEIEIQYTNLVSSRSTIRDANIAKVSAEYIQQQILQQAAATLMSTANQSPAIALQLI